MMSRCLIKSVRGQNYVEGCLVITYHHDVTRPILDSSKEAEDDDDDVEEVGKDGGPLVAQKVKNLSF